ncbi:MAG TPA: tetratricopeptide repeat protein [Labilithrix sp.]|nr:tetratricopeptide repeat protein [Labilithrix sp.]
MRRPRRLFLLAGTLVATVATAQTLRAQPSEVDVKAADALFQSGKVAMDRGDLGTACRDFSRSQRLDPAIGTTLNLGECEARSGKLASALAHYKEVRAKLPQGDFRISFADQRIAELVRRAPRIVMRLAPKTPALDDMSVLLDGVEVQPGALGKAVPIDPGAHVCVVRAPGRADERFEATVREGEERVVELSFGPPQGAAPEVAVAAPRDVTSASSAPPPDAGGRQRTFGLVLGGAGAVGIVVGSVFGVVAKSSYDDATAHCPSGPDSCDPVGTKGGARAHTQATTATASFVLGGLLLAGGITLYLTAPKATTVVSLAPLAGPHVAGIGIAGAL